MTKTVFSLGLMASSTLFLTLTGCDTSATSAIEDRDAYFRSLSTVVENNINAGASAVAGATASGNNAPGWVSTADDEFQSMTQFRILDTVTSRISQRAGEDDILVNLDLQTIEEFGTLSDTDNGMLLSLDTTVFCTDETMSAEDINQCTTLINDTSVLFTQSGDQSGSITLQYEGNAVFIMDFTPSSLAGTWVLSGMKALLEDFDPEAEVPATFNGRIKAEVASTGATSGRITLSVPEAINIGDSSDSYQLQVGQTNALLVIEGDETAGTGTVGVDLTTLSLQGTDDEGSLWDLTVPAFTFNMTGNNKGTEDENDDDLTATASLGSPINLTKDGEDRLTVNPFTLDANMTLGVLTFNEALNFYMSSVEDIILDGMDSSITNTLDVSITAGTELESTEDCDGSGEPGTVVNSGEVSITLSEDADTTISINASAGACFEDEQ